MPVPFTFVARAKNLIRGRPDLDDTIKRLQAFANAGADVLYAPGLRDLETMRRSRLRPRRGRSSPNTGNLLRHVTADSVNCGRLGGTRPLPQAARDRKTNGRCSMVY